MFEVGGEQCPQLQNVPQLTERAVSGLSRPAICAARTAHDVVNPSLLGLPVKAALRVLALLPARDIAQVRSTTRTSHTRKCF